MFLDSLEVFSIPFSLWHLLYHLLLLRMWLCSANDELDCQHIIQTSNFKKNSSMLLKHKSIILYYNMMNDRRKFSYNLMMLSGKRASFSDISCRFLTSIPIGTFVFIRWGWRWTKMEIENCISSLYQSPLVIGMEMGMQNGDGDR